MQHKAATALQPDTNMLLGVSSDAFVCMDGIEVVLLFICTLLVGNTTPLVNILTAFCFEGQINCIEVSR